MLNKIIRFFLEQKLVTITLLIGLLLAGYITAPFNWHNSFIERSPVPVDAIPDIGENQQIIYTEWAGQSPQDVEDQITYPLTTALLGVPGVKTIRSSSIFGLSSIYIIFEENVEFYWSRTRILEKLNSLPSGTLPADVTPALGPDATALGQVYWYTLEGRDPKTGKPNGGWDPEELRTIQDFYVRYYLTAAKGVSEVASIGGFQKEYQVELNPDAMRAYDVTVQQVINAIRNSNLDIGARTIEFNHAEYLVRGLGYIHSLSDLEESVVKETDNVPIKIKDVAVVQFGPATRRGGLDKSGVEAVGGVVVVRNGANPLETISNVKEKIAQVESGLPSKVLEDGTTSKVTIVPFYDRSGLIHETLGTLESALSHEILISILVVIVLVLNLRASILISSLLPIGVLMTFIVMKAFHVDANIVALSGIAIAIGVMVDIGIVFTENILRHLDMEENKGVKGKELMQVIYNAVSEVSSAIITALATTVLSFIPVFAMQAAEGKLFRPLAYTKTFALMAALVIGLVFIPTFAHFVFSIRLDKKKSNRFFNSLLLGVALVFIVVFHDWIAIVLVAYALNNLFHYLWPEDKKKWTNYINIGITIATVLYYLSMEWMPLGVDKSLITNFLFVLVLVSLILAALLTVVHYYVPILRWALVHKWKFMALPFITLLFGAFAWLGSNKILGFLPDGAKENKVYLSLKTTFPGIGSEFMPALNEGSFLLMPTTMPHSGIEENLEVISEIDQQINTIPEVDIVVGKWGRATTALDPAPTSMYENIINYLPEFKVDEDGYRMRFKVDKDEAFILKNGETYKYGKSTFRRIATNELIPDPKGEYFRQWRPQIKNPDDIWNEIVAKAKFPGMTSAPKLQPIQTRLVMLATGMRAPMGIKLFGPDLKSLEKAGMEMEKALKKVGSIDSTTVFADRVVGKPYLEIVIDREKIARYGLSVKDIQQQLGVLIGGKKLTTTVEGRERYPVRLRYARDLRDDPDDLKNMIISSKNGTAIQLKDLATIEYVRGPQMIKSENTFLVSYVIFDMKDGHAEVDVVNEAQKYLDDKIKSGELVLPQDVTYKFTGNYENQVRATKRLMIVIPISLVLIFMILYFQFRTIIASMIHFSGVFVAFAGGFIMIWLYNQDWFMNFYIDGVNMRDLFQIHPINMSVAVWVGFIALFGIATDDGVIMGTYIHQTFEEKKPTTIEGVREAVIEAGSKRVRPAIMTAATAIISLLPVLTSTGKGADVLIPMAIPTFGGMTIQLMTMFIVPILQCFWREGAINKQKRKEASL